MVDVFNLIIIQINKNDFFNNNYVLNFIINQLKILMNRSINLRVLN